MLINPLVVGFGCRFELDNLVLLPSLIPGLLARPSTPFLCWKSGATLKSQLFATLHSWTPKWVQQGAWECVKAIFKALHECLKLHLLTSYTSTTFLTRGYFLILFENEERAISTRKLTTIEWSGLCLSFSRFLPDFDANVQGAEVLLMCTIKVQFPNLHEQFRNAKSLTIMASKLGEVLDIEATNSYIKRPLGPMVTIEV